MVEGSVDLQELQMLRLGAEENETKIPEKDTKKNQWRIILEPALIGSMMGINLAQTSLQNFYLRTACTVDLNYTTDICEKGVGEEFRIAEAESQMVVAGVNISRSFIGSLMSAVVLLFIGPWSDCSGRRKPLLIMPLVGMSVMTTAVLLMLTFPGANTAQVLYAVQIPISMGGNFGLLLAASFSYIGDVCHATGTDITRTMGIHRAAMQIAHVLGAVGGPLLYRHLGFYGVFPLVLILQLSSLLYVIVFVKDVNVNTSNEVSVFNYKLPYNAIQCLLKKREGNKRMIILLMLVVALGDRMLLSAEVLIAYMFYRYKFNFDDVLFGSYVAYRNIASFIGTLIILSILKRRLKLTDETVGVLSCISYVVSTSGLILTKSAIVVFIIPIIGILSQGSQVVQRPLLNKQILPNEQGKIYSVLGGLESATQTMSSPLFSLLYKKTVSTMPDAWLIPGIGLAIIQSCSYLFTKKLNRNTTETGNIQNKLGPMNEKHDNQKHIMNSEKESATKSLDEKDSAAMV